MQPSGVHIVPDRLADVCLREGLGLPRDCVLIHHDRLSCGPLPALDSVDVWRDMRTAYMRAMDIEGVSLSFEGDERDLLLHQEALQSAKTITVWLGTGLDEQLMLALVVVLLRRLGVEPSRCHIVQFSRDRHEIVAVGILDPRQFKEHPLPTRLTSGAAQEAIAAWEAVTSPEPNALLAFLVDRPRGLPFLPRALRALLHLYPDVRSGLNVWDYQLLQFARDEGPKATRVIGHTMAHDMDVPEWKADAYLFHRLHRLANSTQHRPLLILTGDTRSMRGTEVRVTPQGEAILAGEGNAVMWNGIDDWVGGVHLDSRAGTVWFRSEQTLVPYTP